uniref:Beta-lactamase domain protein n=1 Tax=Diaphorobacter sp. PCA039 TaxID=266831 RepID=C0KGN1_9BURK|nr:beta-lactamase domain protein [Diaphorobacter sp. PCA039]
MLSGPWPGMNTVWSPMGHSLWVMLSISCWWLPPGKSVRPMLPANSTSPTKARSICGAWNTTWPGVWPGQWRTLKDSWPMATVSPSCSQRVGVKGCAGAKPNMALCCARPSIQYWSPSCGPMMGRCSRCASSPVPPAWSMCACVSQMAFRCRPRRCASASSTSRSPPGSMTAASWVWSHQTREQFCWNGVTGTVWYCSMRRLSRGCGSSALRRVAYSKTIAASAC